MFILLVDDSAVARLLLSSIFIAAGHQVLLANDGYQALELLKQHKPDIVTMDVHMPGINGFQTIILLLEQHSLPVIVLTASANAKSAATAIQALACGALAVLEKPVGPTDPEFDAKTTELLQVLQLMVQVKVVKRLRPSPPPSSLLLETKPLQFIPKLLAIAASAGGPAALKLLLPPLSKALPWPVLLIQHISHGFLDSFVDWVQQQAKLPVRIATHGQTLLAGHIYLPPDGFHLEVDELHQIKLCPVTATDLFSPSANRLFQSLAKNLPHHVIAVQLSGMGHDGAAGMKAIADAGGLTLVQEPGTALIDSMPKAALRLCHPIFVNSPQGIAEYINRLMSHCTVASRKETL